MTSHDKPLLVKQLFKLINFEILRQGSQIQAGNLCGGGGGIYLFQKITLSL